jgi:hypothetical protein
MVAGTVATVVMVVTAVMEATVVLMVTTRPVGRHTLAHTRPAAMRAMRTVRATR